MSVGPSLYPTKLTRHFAPISRRKGARGRYLQVRWRSRMHEAVWAYREQFEGTKPHLFPENRPQGHRGGIGSGL